MKAIVLSSGGVDSTTCLAMAVHELGKENVVTLSFEYGQRHSKELEGAQKVADFYGVKHVVFNLTQIFSFSNCSLLSNSTENRFMRVTPIKLQKTERARFRHMFRLETA